MDEVSKKSTWAVRGREMGLNVIFVGIGPMLYLVGHVLWRFFSKGFFSGSRGSRMDCVNVRGLKRAVGATGGARGPPCPPIITHGLPGPLVTDTFSTFLTLTQNFTPIPKVIKEMGAKLFWSLVWHFSGDKYPSCKMRKEAYLYYFHLMIIVKSLLHRQPLITAKSDTILRLNRFEKYDEESDVFGRKWGTLSSMISMHRFFRFVWKT